MPTALGEYCIRCGSKTVPTPSEDDTHIVYVCPRGCGVQLITEKTKTAASSTTKAEEAAEPHSSKTKAEEAAEPHSFFKRERK